MDRILFGDNQFFGVNHMSEEKARAAGDAVQGHARHHARSSTSPTTSGIRVFMCTTHDRVGEIVRHRARQPGRYPDFSSIPCMPYAHKYANSVGEVGVIETIRRFSRRAA